jgi:hypothetical protein
MSEVKRYQTAGFHNEHPAIFVDREDYEWLGEDVVRASAYDALAAQLAAVTRERDEHKCIVDQLRQWIEAGATISRHSKDIPVLKPPSTADSGAAWGHATVWTGGLSIQFPDGTALSARAALDEVAQMDHEDANGGRQT